jgi:hypothetical protein
VARPSVGNIPQTESRTALFAHIAGRLAGVPVAAQVDFFRSELRVAIGRDGADAVAASHRHPDPRKRRRGRAPGQPRPDVSPESAALRDWLLVEELKLDLDLAIVRFPGAGAKQGRLLQALTRLAGVRQVFELTERRDLLAVLLFDGRRDRRRLRAELEELADVMVWEDIESESSLPAVTTWARLAQAAATNEGFRLD